MTISTDRKIRLIEIRNERLEQMIAGHKAHIISIRGQMRENEMEICQLRQGRDEVV